MRMSLSDECKTLFQTTVPYICFSFVYIAQVILVWKRACTTILHNNNSQKLKTKDNLKAYNCEPEILARAYKNNYHYIFPLSLSCLHKEVATHS